MDVTVAAYELVVKKALADVKSAKCPARTAVAETATSADGKAISKVRRTDAVASARWRRAMPSTESETAS